MPAFLLLILLTSAAADSSSAAVISWDTFYGSVQAEGLVFSEYLKSLEGKTVMLRGYAVNHPSTEGGLFLTRFEHHDPDGVDEHDLPFDAVAILWKKGIDLPPVPRRPTVEGILRLGNRRFDENVVVTITIEEAAPVLRQKED